MKIKIEYKENGNHIQIKSNPLFTEKEVSDINNIISVFLGKILNKHTVKSIAYTIKKYFVYKNNLVSIEVINIKPRYEYVGDDYSTIVQL